MRRLSSFAMIPLVGLLLSPGSMYAQPERCGTPTAAASASSDLTNEFGIYRPGTAGVDVRYRDLEFGWDTLFAAKLLPPMHRTLDGWAGMLLLGTGISPIAPSGRGLEVVYDYFRLQGSDWTDDLSQTPLRLGVGTVASSYSVQDRGHVDLYLTVPNRLYQTPNGPRNYGGQHPSGWNALGEDLTTGWPADTALAANSISLDGPPIGSEVDTLGTGWTRARTSYQTYFHHEFQHMLPPFQAPANGTEFWSGAAEVVGGHYDLNPTSEFPYNFPMPNEYQARTGFMAYVAYNFLNADTNRTLAGMRDDLLYKWAKARANSGGLQQLGDFLTDAQCATCATKQYFRPGGVPLPGSDRVGVLLHYWRMAMFADNPAVAEGQFGFPAWSGFKPSVNLKAWTSFAGTFADDVDALPQVVTLTQAEITTPRTFRHTRTLHGGSRGLALSQAGANYWVIRADSALRLQNRRLVARITPLAALRVAPGSFGGGGRLHASFLTYMHADTTAAEESILWRRPEWLAGATGIQTIELDSTASEVELEVPDFGQSSQVAVLVLTISDGRIQGWGNDLNSLTRDALPYRLDLDLRESPEPFVATPLFAAGDSLRATPAWARDDTTLVFSSAEPTGLVRLWRKSITGGAPQALNQQQISQLYPDCSPFADLVVYEGIPNPQQANETNLYLTPLAPTNSASAMQLTSHPGCEAFPAFQPDGKGIAYLHSSSPGNWDLRWVSVEGTGDMLIANVGTLTNGACRPRWSPTGNSIYVAKANAGNRIHSVSKFGGAWTLLEDHPLAVNSFDLHMGLGPNALATISPLPATTPAGAPPLLAPRIALYVAPSATRDTTFRFNRTAMNMDAPRISPRGTRVAAQAFRANGKSQIHWGRIEDNVPPSIGALSTQVGYACLPMQIGLPASDPDGEPLSWSMAYAPPGAQIVQGNVFRWQHPVVGEYEAVFRARDPRGGLDSRLILISISDGGYCEDPLSGGGQGGGGFRSAEASGVREVNGWTSNQSSRSNSFLDGAGGSEWASQVASLPELPATATGECEVIVRSGAPNGARLDRAQLITVDHLEGMIAAAGTAGLLFGRTAAPNRIESISGPEWTLVGQEQLLLESGSVVELSFAPTHEARGVILHCQQGGPAGPEGVEVLVRAGAGWSVVDRLHPRRGMDALASSGVVADTVRLHFTSPTIFKAAARVLWSPMDQASFTIHESEVEAVDGASAATVLRAIDQEAVRIEPSTPRVLRFVTPPSPEDRTRVRFLRITGRVEGSSALIREAEPALASSPTGHRFELRRIDPNPAIRTVAITYSLATEGVTELAVFSVQGSRVRTLVKGRERSGGHHATWDGRDDRGMPVAVGTYFVRLSHGTDSARRRFVLLR